jgi:hypothetical protein
LTSNMMMNSKELSKYVDKNFPDHERKQQRQISHNFKCLFKKQALAMVRDACELRLPRQYHATQSPTQQEYVVARVASLTAAPAYSFAHLPV